VVAVGVENESFANKTTCVCDVFAIC